MSSAVLVLNSFNCVDDGMIESSSAYLHRTIKDAQVAGFSPPLCCFAEVIRRHCVATHLTGNLDAAISCLDFDLDVPCGIALVSQMPDPNDTQTSVMFALMALVCNDQSVHPRPLRVM